MKLLPKIIFLDLDGTLLDKGIGVWAKLSKKNENAVNKFSHQGIVVLSTGRMFSPEIQEIAQKVNAKYVICQNGAIIYNAIFEELQNLTIEKTWVKKIIELVQDWNLTFVANPGNKIYGKGFWKHAYALFSHFSAAKFETFQSDNLNKILIIGNSRKKIRRFHKFLEQEFKDVLLSKIVGKDFAIEINNINSSKGLAALKIAEFENIDIKETIHIGDSMNDSSTKNIVGKLIAMKSGSSRLKSIADEIGPKRRNAGISKIINNFLKKNL